ncbi:MAG: CinA family protein [Eubacteriales bacterium]|nr:CinA family protein [Eubacteriales bacterium]
MNIAVNNFAGEKAILEDAEDLARQVLSLLSQRHESLATAESCTAGLIAATLGRIPGASLALLGGLVTYTVELKQALLGVAASSLNNYGVVSEQVAAEMVQGLQACLHPQLAIAVTGLAGPGGATPTVPVGTVCFALSYRERLETWTSHFPGDRVSVQAAACREGMARALSLLVSL